MLIMAERVNHPPHYNAGGIECIDALEAATSGLQGIEAFCTANAIKYLWRWKLKNGEEDLQKAVWYINRLIQRAGADSAAGKELFNMKENKHGFEPKQEFTMGGIAWTVIQTGADWVKCITSDCVEERAFDEGNKNDFAASSLRAYLNGEFLRRLIKAGAPEEMFEYFNIDLTADDGLKNYGGDRVRIGLITCEEYRLLRGNIPALPDRWWWTATPDSPINSFGRYVISDGSLGCNSACNGNGGVRPLCNLKSEILVSYLNGENAEEQKKRAEAVDMMKHIAAAWDIDAEEVSGGLTNDNVSIHGERLLYALRRCLRRRFRCDRLHRFERAFQSASEGRREQWQILRSTKNCFCAQGWGSATRSRHSFGAF